MKRLTGILTAVLLAVSAGSASGGLIITGVFDGPLPGGDPKGIEVYATRDIDNLSKFAVGTGNNGGGTDGVEDIFPAVPLAKGSFYYLDTNADGDFTQWFGFAPDFDANQGVNHNGDDGIEIFKKILGAWVLVDEFGDVDSDGTGSNWEVNDGWGYRDDNAGGQGNAGAFDETKWSYSGANAWDGDDNVGTGFDNGTNAQSTPPFPTGTYVPEPASLALVGLGGLTLLFRRRRSA